MAKNESIEELEAFFNSVDLPSEICFNGFNITDVKSFIDSHISTVKFNINKSIFKIYYNRLIELKSYLITFV